MLSRVDGCLESVPHVSLQQSGLDVEVLEPLFQFQQALFETILELGALLVETEFDGLEMILDGGFRFPARLRGSRLQIRSLSFQSPDLVFDQVFEFVIVVIELAVQIVDRSPNFGSRPESGQFKPEVHISNFRLQVAVHRFESVFQLFSQGLEFSSLGGDVCFDLAFFGSRGGLGFRQARLDVVLNGTDLVLGSLQVCFKFGIALSPLELPLNCPPKFLELFVEPLCIAILYDDRQRRTVGVKAFQKFL